MYNNRLKNNLFKNDCFFISFNLLIALFFLLRKDDFNESIN